MDKPKKTKVEDVEPVRSPPSRTIFSIDPKTNQPFMTVECAVKLIEVHIRKFATNLLPKITVEDLTQDLLAKLCASAFDPSKSSAKTFLYMCLGSRCAQIYNSNFAFNKRHLERPDFLLYASRDESNTTYATDSIGTEDATPEDYLLAKETYEAFINEPTLNRSRNAPRGWCGLRDLKTHSED